MLSKKLWNRLRVRFHQVSVSMLQQLCDDASDTVLIENNPEWGCNPSSSDSNVFNEKSIASIIAVLAALMLTLGVNGP